jgi:LacI family transcriptional regulator
MQVEGGYNAVQRVNGFKNALQKYNLSLATDHLFEVRDYSYSDGTKVMTQLLERGSSVDAIFCAAGDECAKGILGTALKKGVKIPQDIAVIGYDDMEIAKTSTPPLTTVRQPLEEMAVAAYNMATIGRFEAISAPKKVSFKPELVLRESA